MPNYFKQGLNLARKGYGATKRYVTSKEFKSGVAKTTRVMNNMNRSLEKTFAYGNPPGRTIPAKLPVVRRRPLNSYI